MSQYSDFFGVASSGGGGLPVNSYTGIYQSGSYGLPNFDASTGLYSPPDGTYWLKTGDTLDDSAGTYPAAARVPDMTGTWTQVGWSFNTGGTARPSSPTMGIWSDGSDVYLAAGNFSQASLKRYSKAGTYSAELTGYGLYGYLSGDNANDKLWLAQTVNTNVVEYNYSTLTASGTTFTRGSAQEFGIYYNTDNSKFYTVNANAPYPIKRYSSTFTLETTLTPTFPTTGVSYGITSFAGSNYLYVTNNNVYYAFALDLSDPVGVQLLGTGMSLQTDSYMESDEAWAVNQFLNVYADTSSFSTPVTIGDPTAKTDSDAAVPLFVRIG
jgi:hypothetical protein